MTIFRHGPLSSGKGFLVFSFCLFATAPASAQTRVGAITQSAGSAPGISGGQVSIAGYQGTLTDPTGTAGSNPGNTLFTYGNGSGGRLIIDSTSGGGAASLKFFSNTSSAASAGASGNIAADNFIPTVAFTRTIILNNGSSAALYIRASDSTPTNITNASTYLDLSSSGDLTANNARLNAIYKFDSSNFLKSDGVGGYTQVTTADGTFSYSLSNFSNGFYKGIDLNYTPTPVPEPACIFTIGAAMFLVLRRVGYRPTIA